MFLKIAEQNFDMIWQNSYFLAQDFEALAGRAVLVVNGPVLGEMPEFMRHGDGAAQAMDDAFDVIGGQVLP